MKKIFIIILGLTIGFFSCETQRETFDEFTQDGEANFLGAPLEVITKPGLNKIEFSIVINSDPRITKGQLTSSLIGLDYEFDVVRQNADKDTVVFTIDNLPEGDFTVNVVLKDDNGNQSITKNARVRVYGEAYKSGLAARLIENFEATQSEITINWLDPQAGLLATTIEYEDANGDIQSMAILNEDTQTVISSYKRGGLFNVTSTYKPTEDAIEDFEAIAEVGFPLSYLLDKSLVSVVALTGDVGSGGCWGFPLDRLFDGTDTMWHSCDEDRDYPPFTQTFDLGTSAKLSQFALKTRQDCCQDRSPSKYQIWGAADLSGGDPVDIDSVDLATWEADSESKGWVKLLEVDGNTQVSFDVQIPTDNAPNVRYFRMVVLDIINGGNTSNYAEYTLWAQ